MQLHHNQRVYQRFKTLIQKILDSLSATFNIKWDYDTLDFGPRDSDKVANLYSEMEQLQRYWRSLSVSDQNTQLKKAAKLMSRLQANLMNIESYAEIEGVTEDGEVVLFKTEHGQNTKTNRGWSITIGDFVHNADEVSKAWSGPNFKEEDWSS